MSRSVPATSSPDPHAADPSRDDTTAPPAADGAVGAVTLPRRTRVLALSLALGALAGMGASLSLPTVNYSYLGGSETYSIPGGIIALWEDGTEGLALLVFSFSIVLPLFKLAVVSSACVRGRVTPRVAGLVTRLDAAGKWSTLDFWVVAMFVGAIQLGLATGASRPGIHLFLAAMTAGILATRVLAMALPAPPATPTARGVEVLAGRAAHLAAGGCLVMAWTHTLLEVKKAVFLHHEVGVLDAVAEFWDHDELWLALGTGAFVLLAPAARWLLAGVAHWTGGARRARLARWQSEVARWDMLAVLGLALVVVATKLGALATVHLAPDALALLAAAGIGALDGRVLRRSTAA